jgi:hypothetical protein
MNRLSKDTGCCAGTHLTPWLVFPAIPYFRIKTYVVKILYIKYVYIFVRSKQANSRNNISVITAA